MSALRVAAVQMQAGLAEVDGNLDRAARLIERAVSLGAGVIVLPEFFTTAMAFDDRMLDGARPVDGEPAQLLSSLAAKHGVVVGGSFLATHPDGHVRNTFQLAGPNGPLGAHDKDIPTMWENCYYVGGTDDGIIDAPFGSAGVALCWEIIRSETARRLRGEVSLLVGGSCWWDVPDNLPPAWLWRIVGRQNRELCDRAVPALARLVGAPMVHANWAGAIDGSWMLGTRYSTRYVQHASIVDAEGRELARRGPDEGAGVIVADLELRAPAPTDEPPERFWLHAMNRQPHWRLFWWLQNAHGRRYYRARARTPG